MADTPSVALLIERANAQRDNLPLPEVLTDLKSVQKIQHKIHLPGAWAVRANFDSRLAGICIGYPVSQARDLPVQYAGGEYISLLMVEPAFWGRRVASTLIDYVAELARQKNSHELLLLTREAQNDHARTIYEHKGFVLTGDTRPSKYGTQVLYIMRLYDSCEQAP